MEWKVKLKEGPGEGEGGGESWHRQAGRQNVALLKRIRSKDASVGRRWNKWRNTEMWHSYHPCHGIEMWQNYPSCQLFLRLSGFSYVVAMDSSSSCSRAFQFWDSVNDSAQY